MIITDTTARWIAIILSIVASTIVNRILNDRKIQELENKMIEWFNAQLALMGLPPDAAKVLQQAASMGETEKPKPTDERPTVDKSG